MRSLHTLVWRSLVSHRLRSLLTALAITLGVGMVLAAAIVGQAASQTAAELSEEGHSVDLVISSQGSTPFDQGILDLLQGRPEVELASPSLRIEADRVDPAMPRQVLLGVDPAAYVLLHEPELVDGSFLDGPGTIVLPMAVATSWGLRTGDEVALGSLGAANGRTVSLTVAGQLEAQRELEALAADSSVAFVPLGVAQALAGAPGGLSSIEVSLRPGVGIDRARNDLSQMLGPELVVARAVVTEGVQGNVVLVQAGLAVVGLIILFAAGFVILNAFSMSVTGRTRELGALRALGMTRGCGRAGVMRLVLAEAGLLGLAGTLMGALAGLGLAWAVMRVMGTLQDAPLAVPPWAWPLSALMGLGVTLGAALYPAWRAGRVSPIVATRPEASLTSGWYVRSGGRVGAVLLGLLLLGTAAYGVLGRPDVWHAQVVMVLGQGAVLGATVLLLPGLVAPVAAFCRPFLSRLLGPAGGQVIGRLAADNLGRNRLRTALTSGALTAGLTIIVATSGLMTAGLKGSVSRIRTMANEDGFITGDLAAAVTSQEMTVDNFLQYITSDDLGFDLEPVVTALEPLVDSGLVEVTRYRFQTIPSELSAIPGAPGLFVDPEVYLQVNNFDFFEGDPEAALAWMQRGRAMLLMPITAARLSSPGSEQPGVRVGDEILVQTERGEVPFTVAGIGGGGFMMTVLPYADGEAYFGVTKPSFLGIVVPGKDARGTEESLAKVQEAIRPFPGIKLHDFRSSLDPLIDMIGQLELLLNGLLLLAVVVAAMGVVNTMAINVAERQREIGLLRAVGATQRQVRRVFVAEAALLGFLAALVAAVLGLLMLLSWGILVLPYGTASVGVRPDWDTIRLTLGAGLRDWCLAAAVSLVLGPLVAALAAYVPARWAAALDVVEATRTERVTLRRGRRGARQRSP
jgi:putative ABC transport system permease protein